MTGVKRMDTFFPLEWAINPCHNSRYSRDYPYLICNLQVVFFSYADLVADHLLTK